MDVEEIITRRRSVRSYKDKKVPRSLLEEVMDSVRLAPSASNRQDWKFVVVDDEEIKEELYKSANEQDFVRQAPVVIAGVATNPDEKMSCQVNAGTVDVSIALDHLILRAAEEGLGTCWIGAFDQEKTRDILNVPKDKKIIGLITLGYPTYDLTKNTKSRKELKEILSYNSF